MDDDEDDPEASELEQYRICSGCVGEEFLKGEVERDGEANECSYCGKTGKTISIGQLADYVDTAFDQHYYQTPTEPTGIEYTLLKEGGHWDRHGELVTYVIADAAQIDEKSAEHVRRVLERRHFDFDEVAAGEESKFDEESHYEESSVKDYELQAEWSYFQYSLKTESRFFNSTAQVTLDSIFENLAGHSTHDGKPAILDVGPGQEIAAIYRARVFQSREKLENALSRPDIQLGPPPPLLTPAGRMNARGIAVFYGATDADVALAETRPPVGSKVAVSRFEIIRSLRILDIEVLRSIYVEGSIFDSGYLRRLEKAKFLRTLSHRISEPVMPDDEPFEYLITQVIADYLATQIEPALDGIIYPSVQSGGQQKNVVLFHKAARVERLDIPHGTEISAHLDSSDEDGVYPDYWVFETTPPEPASNKADDDDLPILAFLQPTPRPEDHDDPRPKTLRLDITSVTVHHVENVTYGKSSFPVRRHGSVKHEPKF